MSSDEVRKFENPVVGHEIVRDPTTGELRLDPILKPEASRPRIVVADAPLAEGIVARVRRLPGQVPDVILDPSHVTALAYFRAFDRLQVSVAEKLTISDAITIDIETTRGRGEGAWYAELLPVYDRLLAAGEPGPPVRHGAVAGRVLKIRR